MSQELPSGDNTQQVADIQWNEERQPICQRFDDVYFSTDDGLEETRHNFIRPSRLAERFPALNKDEVFRVGETGFGTGLSFLACWQVWQQSNSPGRLEFYSVEKYPLDRTQLKKALVQWPELAGMVEALWESYPSVPAAGWHRLEFNGVVLQLFIGDVLDGLLELCRTKHLRFLEQNRQFDAWFLDGFAPAKNPDMWREDVLECITQLSRRQATVATFTAVSAVRKSLQARGFDMKKASGFGLKREMMAGDFTGPPNEERSWPSSVFSKLNEAPWDLQINPTETQRQVCIIGGGIAASCNARALAEAGYSVTILERHKTLAQEGSGNPQGVLYAKLSHRPETLSQFNLHCLLYAQRFYRALLNNTGANNERSFEAELCGVVQLAQSEKQYAQQGQLLDYLAQYGPTEDFVQRLPAEELSRVSGIDIDKPGLYFPDAGWLNPASACEALCQHPNIEIRFEQEVENVMRKGELWQCLDASGQILNTSHLVVIANANDAKRFQQSAELPLKPVRGQVSYIEASAGSEKLQTVVCGRGYIAPERNGQHCLGASFNLHERTLDLRLEEQQSNFQHLQDDCPSLFSALNTEDEPALRGRVALRCTSPDYLPLVGPVHDAAAMQERFALLSHNAKATIPTPGCYHEGLYISVAYGSRGLCYAPLAAAELLSQIQQAPSPMGAMLRKALNPARFTIRDMIRRKSPNPAVKA
ncbi:bifunctional tRNA (5-methylaminomethyl-2-thiouridine)(34)-methyltransferase MnmD/FAD-dependent 5-carboxymethylaminomethyl-2-thiouridine(34) oxidoreductase MnmC [Pseudoteredinibacter isoporae]|uniref:tRNA 5-methylaminomethyl-2-thiouridine biosynthesis bifunctional protein MnmC n=1 Tax=Pseudoteredinibacter isoporae TaxID=570281 RepID=A0A7X0JV88_9GAMM|nr:bifunctional tRNA (5-methylaminomethyl-2-thiouridine)(34)-methyltransferase MnmD/FAD-dependent 5-carboxymethylaminomethyl-2-thiouridine(34) oxidoreductase MnmC [Pseudoteredinibacter isoporae]MBB6522368.1 tRNA 5-methylaminomethyl-2-thiouridine biosynthesis bifunctional protein [Pseudoteredinibacter isoporae]NHO87901.1 bifunctional tRNA (5-methylaminomethyl-2-thiouridine)(34)-methyltransferase MnmD/FAD-dependent 5-carboxymethylaminomethyl-2-thiouridine(34) oxidoreductase MnmC [Pseudoteredinibact